jgi:hypothetical protein
MLKNPFIIMASSKSLLKVNHTNRELIGKDFSLLMILKSRVIWGFPQKIHCKPSQRIGIDNTANPTLEESDDVQEIHAISWVKRTDEAVIIPKEKQLQNGFLKPG